MFLVIIAVGLFAFWTNKKKINLVGLTIGVDFMQILSMFGGFDFDWPIALKRMYTSTSTFSFNLELVAPECSFSAKYDEKVRFCEACEVAPRH